MKANLSFLTSAACALLLALPSIAANAPAVAHKTVKPAGVPFAWPAESLTGKITMVDPTQHVLIVQTSDGIPFDMLVTPRTRIESGSQRVDLNGLSRDTNRTVSVRFVPERRGDVARSISLGG